MLEFMEILRKLDREVPAQLISTLLYVASHDGCHKQALEEDLEFTTASGSRNTDYLSPKHRLGNKNGCNLIIKEVDPSNARRLQLRLTDQGHALIQRLKHVLYS